MSKVRIKINGANNEKKQKFFLGSKIFYVVSNGFRKKPKTIWGKIISLHGRNGIFLAKFKRQVSPVELTSFVYIIPKPFYL